MTPEELQEQLLKLQALAQSSGDDGLLDSLDKIRGLPPDQQEAAIAQLTMDYEGRETTLRGELENNYALMTQAGPQGGMAGNNQFSRYVGANPLEHLASGIQKYQAGKGVREGREAIEGLSKSKEAGLGAVAKGMLGEQSLQADILRKKEEEERRRRLLHGLLPGQSVSA
jgi:hypothetical protein